MDFALYNNVHTCNKLKRGEELLAAGASAADGGDDAFTIQEVENML